MKSILLFFLLFYLAITQQVFSDDTDLKEMEVEIRKILTLVNQSDFTSAIASSAILKEKFPNSRVVQLIYADLQNTLAMRSVSVDPESHYSLELLEVLNEIKVRNLQPVVQPETTLIPENILLPSRNTKHIIAIDLSLSRLYLLAREDNQTPFKVIEDYYVSMGRGGIGKQNEGDLKTPTGIYRIDGFRTDEELPPLYGLGAFTLDFPNELDKHQQITGSGIWLHGIPHNQFSRPPLASEGCVVMSNELISHLQNTIDHSTTPVILAENLVWSKSSRPPHPLEKLVRPPQSPIHPDYPIQVLHNLEILAYPATIKQNQTDPLVQVRFLLQSEEPPNAESLQVTQYWAKNPTGYWNLVLEKSEKL